MPEHSTPHDAVADYLLDQSDPVERARFEAHLEICAECRSALGELQAVARMAARAAPAYVLPADLDQKVLAAVRRAAEQDASKAAPTPARSSCRSPRWFARRRRAGFALALGAVMAAAIAIPLTYDERDDDSGEPELVARLVSPAAPPQAGRARVDKLGTGRVVRFETDDLPILPATEYCELWFVGPDDTPQNPDRISAGTFHPDEEGRSQARFHAAVDPAECPVLSVTAEPGDGDPSPSGDEVLRSGP